MKPPKNRQQVLRESRHEPDKVDPESTLLATGLGTRARPVPLVEQIRQMVRNELADTRPEQPEDPSDFDEIDNEPTTIYELAVDIMDNPDAYADIPIPDLRPADSPPAPAAEDPAPENPPSAVSDPIPPPA